MSDDGSSGGGCSCVGLILFILVFWAIFFGLPVPGGQKINIDIFPPRVWDMNEAAPVAPVVPEAPTVRGQ